MHRLLLICFVLTLTCCTDKSSKPDQTDSSVIDTTKRSKINIGKLSFQEFVLDKKAENEISTWWKYKELRDKVEEFKQGDLSHFDSDFEIIKTFMNEFTNTVPLNINNESIQARILTVETMYFRLNDIVNMDNSNDEKIAKVLTGFLEAFSNLNYQINKKFERDFQRVARPE